MKKISVLSLAIPLFIFAQSSKAQTTNIDWTFESLVMGTAYTNAPADGLLHGVAADVGTGTASGFHAVTGGGQYSAPVGDNSTKSLSANRWSVGDYYQFSTTLDLAHYYYSGFTVSYEQNGSASGPSTFDFAWSTDGTTFTTVGGDYTVSSGITWGSTSGLQGTLKSFDLSGVTALNTASTVYFRIIDNGTTAVNSTAVGTGGTDRIDDFTIIAAIPEPTSLALAALGGFSVLGLSIFKKRQ